MATFDLGSVPASNPLVKKAQEATAKLESRAAEALSRRSNNPSTKAISNIAQRIQKGGLKAIDKTQVKNLAESKLADTIFRSGPKDAVLAVDVFGISDTSVLNSLTDKLSGFALSAMDNFRKSTGINTDLTSLLKSSGNGFSFDAKALTDRVMSAIGGSGNSLRGLTDQLQKTLTSGIGIDPSIYSKVEAVVNGVSKSFDTNNLKDARGIFSLVNQLTNNDELAQFFDVGAEANVLSGLVREAIKLGIPETIQTLIETAKSSRAADYALRGNIGTAVTLADLTTTQLLVDQLGLNRVISDVPNAPERVMANYSLPEGIKNEELDTELARLVTTLDKLRPGWSQYSRNGVLVSDLSLYTYASVDAKKLLMRDPTHRVAMTIAPSYRAVRMVEQAKRMYPLLAI